MKHEGVPNPRPAAARKVLPPLAATLVVLGAAALIAGGVAASNMGFKTAYELRTPANSDSGTTTLGLPFVPKAGMQYASDLIADIEAQGFENVVEIQRYDTLTDSNVAYPGSADFTLAPGEGYLVRLGSGATPAGSNYRIVGSHDPNAQLEFKAAAMGVSISGTHRYAPPPHTVASTASELISEIGAVEIQRWDPATDSWAAYPGIADFALVRGEAYMIRVSSDVTSYIPEHY